MVHLTRKDPFATFAAFSRVLKPSLSLLLPVTYAPSVSLLVARGFLHHVSLTTARLLPAFTFPPRHASRSRSLSLSFASRARHSLSPAASKTHVSKLARLVSAYPHPRLRLSPSRSSLFRCGRCAYTRVHTHTHTRTYRYT